MVNQQFANQIIGLIKGSDMLIHEPEWREVFLNENGGTTHKMNLSDSLYKKTEIKNNEVLLVMLLFSMLDAYVDATYPTLEGESFAYKYRNLSSSNDTEIIIREVYRILKILRNASIHSRSNVQRTSNNELYTQYSRTMHNRITNFELKISQMGLELIGTFIMIIITFNQLNRSDSYKLALLRTFYDDIQKEILTISDEFGIDNLSSISEELRLKRGSRFMIMNPRFTKETEFKIEKLNVSDMEKEFADYEYIVSIDETQKYIVL